MGVLADYIERRLADELDRRGTVVWYDEADDWRSFVERKPTRPSAMCGLPDARPS